VFAPLLASVLTLSLSTGIKTSVDKHKGKDGFDTSTLGQLIFGNGGGDRFIVAKRRRSSSGYSRTSARFEDDTLGIRLDRVYCQKITVLKSSR